jgi:ABC-2 type transport system ATP-binding protein
VLGEVIRELGSWAVEVDDIGLRRPTLDEAFLFLTGAGTDADAAPQDAADGAVRDDGAAAGGTGTDPHGPRLAAVAAKNETE